MTQQGLPFRTVGVVGLGLIGGSLARDLAALGIRVYGYDRDAAATDMAVAAGVVAEPLDASLAGLDKAELVIVAVPVSQLPGVLATAGRSVHWRLVTDVGSTKRAAIAAADACGIGERYVGSHPMAGDHLSGWTASRAGLFTGARVYLCPTRATAGEALALAHELWRVVGACPEVMGAAAHDHLVGYASHLPKLTSTALALALAQAGVHRKDLGRGGRDGTRLAEGSAEMWTDIVAENADVVLPALDALAAQVERLRAAIARRDSTAVQATFSAALAWCKSNDIAVAPPLPEE